jgi:hypothetical protein
MVFWGCERVLIDTHPLQLSRAQVELSMEWENFEDRACINYLQPDRTEESPTP